LNVPENGLTMGKTLISLLIISFLLSGPLCYSQTSVEVSDPRVEFKERKLLISYDILNSKASDHFMVGMEIKDADGNLMITRNVKGDIGPGISGGNNKLIIWDIEADQVSMDGDIFINITAEYIPAYVDESFNQINEVKTYNRYGLIAQSLLFPGLGLSRYTGDPHWLKGVAGYGCIAGSIAFNQMAKSTYEDFKSASTVEDANSLLAQSKSQDNTSELFAYAAIGIWVTDIIWTIIGTSGLSKKSDVTVIHGVYKEPGAGPLACVPFLGVSYKF